MVSHISVIFIWAHKFALEYIGIYSSQFCVNIPSNFERISGIATVWKCYLYITFSRNLVVHTMVNWVLKVLIKWRFFEPKKFNFGGLPWSWICSIGYRNNFFAAPKQILFALSKCLDTWPPIFPLIKDMWLNILSFKKRPVCLSKFTTNERRNIYNVFPTSPGLLWNEIAYPFPNFNGANVDVWVWINNFIPHFIMD